MGATVITRTVFHEVHQLRRADGLAGQPHLPLLPSGVAAVTDRVAVVPEGDGGLAVEAKPAGHGVSMSYQCGAGQSMARFGLEPGPPHIRCDNCGMKLEARAKGGCAPTWLLDEKAPRGWLLILRPSGVEGVRLREDYCPACRVGVAVVSGLKRLDP
jgi:hypothetical protein